MTHRFQNYSDEKHTVPTHVTEKMQTSAHSPSWELSSPSPFSCRDNPTLSQLPWEWFLLAKGVATSPSLRPRANLYRTRSVFVASFLTISNSTNSVVWIFSVYLTAFFFNGDITDYRPAVNVVSLIFDVTLVIIVLNLGDWRPLALSSETRNRRVSNVDYTILTSHVLSSGLLCLETSNLCYVCIWLFCHVVYWELSCFVLFQLF